MFDRMVREVNERALGGGWGRSETEIEMEEENDQN